MRFLVLPFSRTLDSPPARHTEHVARPFSIADNRSLLADAVHCRHGSKLMAVPRGVRGLTARPPRPVGRLMRPPTRTRAKREAPGEAACAAETGRPLLLRSRPLKLTHGQMGGTLPCTMRNATLGARGAFAFPRVRSRMLSGGGACIAGARPPSAEAAPPLRLGRKARFLRLVRGRLAATQRGSFMQRHVEPPHLQSQQQTLSTASRVEQAWGAGRSAVGAHEGRAGRGPGREVQEVRGSNPAGVTKKNNKK